MIGFGNIFISSKKFPVVFPFVNVLKLLVPCTNNAIEKKQLSKGHWMQKLNNDLMKLSLLGDVYNYVWLSE
jgi:hypothetical protein